MQGWPRPSLKSPVLHSSSRAESARSLCLPVEVAPGGRRSGCSLCPGHAAALPRPASSLVARSPHSPQEACLYGHREVILHPGPTRPPVLDPEALAQLCDPIGDGPVAPLYRRRHTSLPSVSPPTRLPGSVAVNLTSPGCLELGSCRTPCGQWPATPNTWRDPACHYPQAKSLWDTMWGALGPSEATRGAGRRTGAVDTRTKETRLVRSKAKANLRR